MTDWQNWKREVNFVGGAWIKADSGKTIDVTNPATGEVIGTVPASGEAETMRAIDAAAAAFPDFAAMDLMSRVGLLWKLHDALMDNQAALAEPLGAALGGLSAAREKRSLISGHGFLEVPGTGGDLGAQRRAVDHREVGTLAGEGRHQVRGVADQRHAG